MSEYSLYDFTESLSQVRRELGTAKVVRVVKAWGEHGDYAEWRGGFVMKLDDGRYCYLEGWCDTSGWGCQDGVEIRFASTVRQLDLPKERTTWWSGPQELIQWDAHPSDLNNWIRSGSPDPYEV